jgi:methyl-accepting chemotaxis protein/methyl-accepting chemotaxis protein-1 (serine sensor receptor)
MNVRKKVTYSVLALASIVGVFGVVALRAVTLLGARLDESANLTTRKVVLFGAIKGDILEFRLLLRNCMYYSAVGHPEELTASASAFGKKVAVTQQEFDQLRPLLVTEKGKQFVAGLAQGVADSAEAGRNLIDLLRAGQSVEAQRLAVEKLAPAGDRLVQQIDAFLDVQNNYVKSASEEAALTVWQSTWAFIALLAVGLIISAVAALAIRGLFITLQGVSRHLTAGAREVSSAAGQAAAASQELAQGSSQQVTAVERISSAVEEIAALTRQNKDSATEAANLMADAQKAGGLVREALGGLETAVGEIHDSSGEIGRILHSIDEIAFQTNILALNAAVEAARAGEAGLGFAVVADEVRNLAQRCAQAARDTAGLIEESIATSRDGDTRLNQMAGSVRGMTESATQVRALVDEVNLGSQEQSRGMEQISRPVLQMERLTQKTAASAEESAAAGTELNDQANSLRELVHEMRVMVGME